MKNQKGFSLIELLIVVVILGLVAAIAIPNLLASRRYANEGSTIAALRTYHSAQAMYQASYGNGNYAGVPGGTNAFTILGSVNLIDGALGSGTKAGYYFAGHSETRTPATPACHLAEAFPTTPSGLTQTGTRIFVVATAGVIHAGPFTGTPGWGPGNCDIAAALLPLE